MDVETADKSEPAFRVMIPRYGIEGRVTVPVDADDPKLQRFPDQHKFTYADGVSIQVFDKVRVNIWVKSSQDYQRELMIDLVEPRFEASRSKRETITPGHEELVPKKKQKRAGKK